jgi:hypothetical protein
MICYTHTWYDLCCDAVIFNSVSCLWSGFGDTNNQEIWTHVIHFHLWVVLKDRVYSSNSCTEYDLKESIQNMFSMSLAELWRKRNCWVWLIIKVKETVSGIFFKYDE